MQTFAARPETVEEVQATIQNWLRETDKDYNDWSSLSRVTRKKTLRVSIARSDMKVAMSETTVQFQLESQELRLNLEKFLVRTAFKDNQFLLDVDRDPAQECHVLAAALREISLTRHPAFYTRILRAVRRFEEDLPNTLIDEATAATSDLMVVLEALSAASRAAELTEDGPLFAAKIRGVLRKQEMLTAAGGALTSEQVAAVLNLSRQAVDKRRSSNQLLALTQGRRGYSYPGFQFEDGKTLPGLEDVLKALNALDPWMQLNFFTSPAERLGGKTPIEALREGRLNDVARVASTYGEQGAR